MPAGDSDVSMRDYVDARLKAQEASLEAYKQSHEQRHVDDQRAIDRGREVIDERLGKLNELRGEVIADRSQFVRFEVYDQKHEALVQRIALLETTAVKSDVLDAQRDQVTKTRRALIVTIIAGLFLTGVNLIINLVQSAGHVLK